MNPNKKVFITILSFVLVFLVVACSCTSLIPSNLIPSGLTGGEAMPGLAGKWQDPETSDTFTIAWQNSEYVVTSVAWNDTSYTITSQNWDGSALTWSYYDTDLALTVTYTTTSLSGDSLNVDWSYDNGTGGTETLGRL